MYEIEQERARTCSLGARVRHARTRAGLTQEAAAVAAGVGVSTLRRIELDRHRPRLDTLRALARVLDASLADLIGEDAV